LIPAGDPGRTCRPAWLPLTIHVPSPPRRLSRGGPPYADVVNRSVTARGIFTARRVNPIVRPFSSNGEPFSSGRPPDPQQLIPTFSNVLTPTEPEGHYTFNDSTIIKQRKKLPALAGRCGHCPPSFILHPKNPQFVVNRQTLIPGWNPNYSLGREAYHNFGVHSS